jgi:signal transduction histidine kinase
MATAPPAPEALPSDPSALQAEVLRLRQTLEATLQEKDRAVRLLRSTNTELYGRVQGQTQQLASLNHLINTITASLDLRQVASTALGGLRTLLRVETAILALRDSGDQINIFMAQPESHLSSLPRLQFKLGEGTLGQVIKTGHAVVLGPVREVPSSTAGTGPLGAGARPAATLCVPILSREQPIGAVQLLNKWAGPFTDPDRAFVETVAGSLAVAIENARMYTEVQSQLADLERTHTELVETQTQLVESAKLASIGQLAAGLAHEINNPIGIILGFAQLIGQRTQDEKLKRFAGTVEREAIRVRRIVSDLLGFARQATAETKRLDLREVLDGALRLVEYQLVKENIHLVSAYGDEPGWVLADHDQLLQVVMNMIQNGRQAMPQGGSLTLRTWNSAGKACFAVADTGVGIPAEDLAHVFDPFFTTKPVGQGTGLGLSVSYGIIKRHGGEIRVTSDPGKGTTFWVALPLSLPDSAS